MSKKFDVVIGNPPYQEDNDTNNRAEAIYPFFYEGAKGVADKYCLITPARFLFNAGATSKKWNYDMLNDTHLRVVYYNPESSDVFTGIDIKGGVVILYRDCDRDFEAIGTFTGSQDMDNILSKIDLESSKSLSHILYNTGTYKLNTEVALSDSDLLCGVSPSEQWVIKSNAFERFPTIFKQSRKKVDDVKIYGRENHGRVFKYFNRQYLVGGDNLEGYKVIIPGANGSGDFGEVLSSPIIGEPGMGHTQTFISMGNYETYGEASALLNYIKCKFTRSLLSVKKVTQNTMAKGTWSKVPLQDFTKDSDIDWSKSIAEIDQQLYEKYNLNEEEINFIETNVKEMD